nr:retrovirus-related Pol polyprotein from transposon TNT 1-94 [Tanacetum cinerariifolium]
DNLFSIGQFYDVDLEVTFKRNTCFIKDLDGVELLKGNLSTNLYTINLYDMASASPICLMARATLTKSWLWHQRLSHLNFDTINDLAKNDLVSSLPKFKYVKEHICPSYEQGKSKRASHPPKPVLNLKQRLHLLHMDLCSPMRVASINDTRNPLSQKLKNKNVELKSQVLNYARENAHLKAHTRTCLTLCLYYLFKNASDHKDNTQNTSANTKFAKKPIGENFPKVGKTNALSKPVTSNSVSSSQEPKGVDNTKTRRPNPRSNIKHNGVPSASKSSRSKNKAAEIEEHHRNLLLSKNNKHISSACNNSKIDSQDVISKVVCAMCKKCLISVNHDKCLHIYVNGKIPRGCSKHMIGNLKLLINFVWKFMGTVRFGNNHVAAILGFGQLCDSDLEVAFRRDACFVRNLEGVDLLKGDRSTNLYTINIYEMASASPICLMARASSIKSWLWHQRLSHLNFNTINDLAKNDLVAGLPKFKYHKEHLCSSCEQGKSKRASHPPKPVPNSRQRLHLLYMDLCRPMRIASINEKRITLLLQSPVIIIRTDNGTEFKNLVLKKYFHYVGVSYQISSVRTPQQNGVVERQNRMLVEDARTMLIFSRAPLFLWAEAIATACFTQNRSIIHCRFYKTPYELINGRKLDISFLHVFGALCYPKNDREDIGKLGAKGDIGFFIGYSADSCAYIIY